MSSRRATRILTLADARRGAGRILPRVLFDYIEGGAEDEITLAENERAFRDLALRPDLTIPICREAVLANRAFPARILPGYRRSRRRRARRR